MRAIFSFLASALVHASVFSGGWFLISDGPPQPTVPVEAITFDLGMLPSVNPEEKVDNTPAKSDFQQAKNSPDSEEPIVEPEPVAEPEPIVEKKTIVIPKKVIKKKRKKTVKKTVKKKPKKVVKKKTKKKAKQTKQPKSLKQSIGAGKKNSNKTHSQSKKSSSRSGKASHPKRNNANSAAYKAGLKAAITRVANRNYPRQARRMRKQGVVSVKFNLAASGKISNVRLIGSSGNRSLDKAAVKSVRRLGRYKKPPVGFKTTVVVPIRFQL